ncbi:NAD(P)/FAD-dependent oxidoreductase [candidate division KSB1 bacterium]|nr:NAD(P)/FAD-dependent oxidoreductase [candidate division KSB1 bacterium]
MAGAETRDLYDVIVIGGGVVGCAILRELSRYDLKILLLEKEADLAEGISKANSGVIHAGFNVPVGSLKARMNVAGLLKIYELLKQLNVPHRKTGKLVVALQDAEKERLEELKALGEANGTPDLSIVNAKQIRELEPHTQGEWALFSPHTGILSPYQFTISLAECAWQNGAVVKLESPVIAIKYLTEYFEVKTPSGSFKTRWIVNSAGLFSDEVAKLAGITDYQIFPYRGEYLITDKDTDFDLRMPVYPVPPKGGPGLGIHITPTVDGNILLGPSAEFVEDKRNTDSTKKVMNELKQEAFELMPELKKLQFIRSFAGVRPKLVDPKGNVKFKDFVIGESPHRPGLINLIGIESPGLTGSPAIAEYVVNIIAQKENLQLKKQFNPNRPELIRFAELDDENRAKQVQENSQWGDMICRCESVTKAEVLHALNNPFGVKTLDGIKRRTRCGTGRCQGGFCTSRIVEIMHQEGIPLEQITKKGAKSQLFFGRIKS